MNINFKASYIMQATITENLANNCTKNKTVSFIELNPQNNEDISCLAETVLAWKNAAFTSSIYQNACLDGFWSEEKDITTKYYAITEQTENFTKPNAHKLLGLVEVEPLSSKLEFIHYIQVKPTLMWNALNSKYKHIGSAMLNAIKQLCPSKDILLDPEEGTELFYLKNGFKKVEESSKMMLKRWK